MIFKHKNICINQILLSSASKLPINIRTWIDKQILSSRTKQIRKCWYHDSVVCYYFSYLLFFNILENNRNSFIDWYRDARKSYKFKLDFFKSHKFKLNRTNFLAAGTSRVFVVTALRVTKEILIFPVKVSTALIS